MQWTWNCFKTGYEEDLENYLQKQSFANIPQKVCHIHTEKYQCWSKIFNKDLQACNFIKRNTNTGVLLWTLQKFWEQPFLKNNSGSYTCIDKKKIQEGHLLEHTITEQIDEIIMIVLKIASSPWLFLLSCHRFLTLMTTKYLFQNYKTLVFLEKTYIGLKVT